jgi:hypothetical protein
MDGKVDEKVIIDLSDAENIAQAPAAVAEVVPRGSPSLRPYDEWRHYSMEAKAIASSPDTSHQDMDQKSLKDNEVASPPLPDTNATVERLPVDKKDWWDFAQMRLIRSFEDALPLTQLLSTRNIRDAHTSQAWREGRSSDIYAEMGACDPARSYVAFWMNLGINCMLFVSEVLDVARLESLLADEPLQRRLKLLLQPIRVSLPFPAKAAKDADFVGPFFGKKATSFSRFRTELGVDMTVVQVDLYSKWLIKTAISTIGFRDGNTIEALLVDWLPGSPTMLSACRIQVTESFQRL